MTPKGMYYVFAAGCLQTCRTNIRSQIPLLLLLYL